MAVIDLYSSIKKDKHNIPHKIVARGKIYIPYAYNYHSLSWLDTGTQQKVVLIECLNVTGILHELFIYENVAGNAVLKCFQENKNKNDHTRMTTSLEEV
jgi:hypothetical protein